MAPAVVASALAAGCGPPAPPPPQAPVTRVETVVDTIHGETFPDPYRWLEAQAAPETRAWIAAQVAYTETMLPRDGARQALERRLAAPMGRAEIGVPRRGGDHEYFTLRRGPLTPPRRYRPPARPDARSSASASRASRAARSRCRPRRTTP
jgi:prolyl oligopeptidase